MLQYQIGMTLSLIAFTWLVFRNLRDYVQPTRSLPQTTPLVSLCLPVRNEEANIEACLRGLLDQTYHHFEIVVLDDCSEDSTASLIQSMASQDSRIRLFSGCPLPPGWAGKCHACTQLAQFAKGDYLLFMDADTRANPDLLASAMGVMQSSNADLVSTFPTQIVGSFWEIVVLPMLQFLITALLPLRQVWETSSPALCAACGQFLLFRRDTYDAVGGHASIPTSFHDGLLLARKIKQSGGKVQLFDGSALLQCRMYVGGRAVWKGFTRNAYEALGSLPVLISMTSGLFVLFLAPFGFLLWGILFASAWTPLCAIQVALIFLIRVLQARRFGHWRSIPLHPLSIAALIGIQWGSLWQTHFGKPVDWKGRVYGLPESLAKKP